MRKTIISCFILLALTACTHILKPYRPPVQQGNVITSEMVQQLKPGLTKTQVQDIFGEPVLVDAFDPNTWTYVYTFQPSRGPTQKKQLVVYFKNDRVTNYIIGLPTPQKNIRRYK